MNKAKPLLTPDMLQQLHDVLKEQPATSWTRTIRLYLAIVLETALRPDSVYHLRLGDLEPQTVMVNGVAVEAVVFRWEGGGLAGRGAAQCSSAMQQRNATQHS